MPPSLKGKKHSNYTFLGSGKMNFRLSRYKKGKPLVFGNNSYEFMQFIFQMARIIRCWPITRVWRVENTLIPRKCHVKRRKNDSNQWYFVNVRNFIFKNLLIKKINTLHEDITVTFQGFAKKFDQKMIWSSLLTFFQISCN